ncbi:hypothetical protein [Escherichia coli]|uniref:hypothetical protein n=1 Tax=Escherichia coli TaxID=562 RepID=UPI0037DD172B
MPVLCSGRTIFWTLNYDEIDMVLEGELHVATRQTCRHATDFTEAHSNLERHPVILCPCRQPQSL